MLHIPKEEKDCRSQGNEWPYLPAGNPALASPYDPEMLAEMTADIAELQKQEAELKAAAMEPQSLPQPLQIPLPTLPAVQNPRPLLFTESVASFPVATFPSGAKELMEISHAPIVSELAPETADASLPLPAALSRRRRLLQVTLCLSYSVTGG